MYGMIFSIKTLISRLSASSSKGGYSTSNYKLELLQDAHGTHVCVEHGHEYGQRRLTAHLQQFVRGLRGAEPCTAPGGVDRQRTVEVSVGLLHSKSTFQITLDMAFIANTS